MVACTTVGLWVEDDDLGFTGVLRTSSVLGGLRTRSVLGGSGLGGGIDGCDLAGAGTRSHRCFTRRNLAGAGCDETVLLVRSPCRFSLSSIFLGRNSFEGKIQTEIVLQGQRAYFTVNGNDFPFDPIFLAHPNTRIYGKAFPEVI